MPYETWRRSIRSGGMYEMKQARKTSSGASRRATRSTRRANGPPLKIDFGIVSEKRGLNCGGGAVALSNILFPAFCCVGPVLNVCCALFYLKFGGAAEHYRRAMRQAGRDSLVA